MSTFQSDAVVVKLIPFRDSDRIAWLVTRDAGLLSVHIAGARKSQKRFANLFDLGNHIRITVQRRKRGMGRVESGFLIDGFWPLSQSSGGLGAVAHVIELLRRFSAEDHPDPRLFDLGTAALKDLSINGVRPFALRAFEAGLLGAAGLAPVLDFCIHCRKALDAEAAVHYSFAQSGVLCTTCGEGSDLPILSAAPRALLSEILISEPTAIFSLPFEKRDLESLSYLLPRQIEYHIGSPLKALRWVRALLSPKEYVQGIA